MRNPRKENGMIVHMNNEEPHKYHFKYCIPIDDARYPCIDAIEASECVQLPDMSCIVEGINMAA